MEDFVIRNLELGFRFGENDFFEPSFGISIWLHWSGLRRDTLVRHNFIEDYGGWFVRHEPGRRTQTQAKEFSKMLK